METADKGNDKGECESAGEKVGKSIEDFLIRLGYYGVKRCLRGQTECTHQDDDERDVNGFCSNFNRTLHRLTRKR